MTSQRWKNRQEPAEAVRMKKGHPVGTCEGCGKTMTLKNLKCAHGLVCPAKTKQFVNDVLFESEVVMSVPIPPKLVRQVTHVEEESAEKPKPKPKPKPVEAPADAAPADAPAAAPAQ